MTELDVAGSGVPEVVKLIFASTGALTPGWFATLRPPSRRQLSTSCGSGGPPQPTRTAASVTAPAANVPRACTRRWGRSGLRLGTAGIVPAAPAGSGHLAHAPRLDLVHEAPHSVGL